MNYHLPVSIARAATAAALLASIAVTALCASSQHASADTYPSRRITFDPVAHKITGYISEGGQDFVTRAALGV